MAIATARKVLDESPYVSQPFAAFCTSRSTDGVVIGTNLFSQYGRYRDGLRGNCSAGPCCYGIWHLLCVQQRYGYE